MAKLVLWEHRDFHGHNEVLYHNEGNLVHMGWNDKVSSFVIESGHARFYEHINFKGWHSTDFGPGKYDWVEDVGIPNDSISSVLMWG